jgi:hypothetical protein
MIRRSRGVAYSKHEKETITKKQGRELLEEEGGLELVRNVLKQNEGLRE